MNCCFERKGVNVVVARRNHRQTPYQYLAVIDDLMELQDTTRKILLVLESIQSKIFCKENIEDDLPNLTNVLNKQKSQITPLTSITDIVDAVAVKNLEDQTKHLDGIYIESEDNDCSVYKRLTRKCNCMNRPEFNDFTIHFNATAKYSTNNLGEIIKNIRILKKFIYIGGKYSENAFKFLIEGFTKCVYAEKADIAQACSHADICNIFENESIVTHCLILPFKYSSYGDSAIQQLTSKFILNLVRVEEGRRYLNLNSKIANDIKYTLTRKKKQLDNSTVNYLNDILNLLNPRLDRNINVTYYFKAEEGCANRVINGLVHFRRYMTVQEIYDNLDLLIQISESDTGKRDLRQFLPSLLNMFKHLLVECDSNLINTAVVTILTNVTKKTLESATSKLNELSPQTPLLVADVCTEPIQMKSQCNQVPSLKAIKKPKSKQRRSRL
ncbi:uncharacterized protein LOC113229526 isoform X2 [Hyposmocoma kahamanoa]|uniref:uncharacterized protein LOC113229526 isoform X2 n=1 Tax=Hyposmocoma kahamanoa TaxID=1477025 RepID=UPI000E6D5E78|nr:uncharacterized protein LOC113229526 isoform X2 [Hyposmocoma kahamanoa]